MGCPPLARNRTCRRARRGVAACTARRSPRSPHRPPRGGRTAARRGRHPARVCTRHAPPTRVSRVCHAWLLLLPPFRQAHAWDRRPHHRCHCAPVTGACASWEAAQEQLDVSRAGSSGEVPARGRAVFDSRRLCLNPRARNRLLFPNESCLLKTYLSREVLVWTADPIGVTPRLGQAPRAPGRAAPHPCKTGPRTNLPRVKGDLLQ